MDWLITLTTALGAAWLSGINLYATVATLGLLQRLGLARLPGDLAVLSNEWIIGLAAVLYVIEFVADKIPVVDSAWDAVHTFIRVPAGAILAAAAFADFDPAVRVAAIVSVLEDVAAVGFTTLMTFFPLVFLVLLVLALIAMAWLIPKIVRMLRRMLGMLWSSKPA